MPGTLSKEDIEAATKRGRLSTAEMLRRLSKVVNPEEARRAKRLLEELDASD
jgi:hypothetical protein